MSGRRRGASGWWVSGMERRRSDERTFPMTCDMVVRAQWAVC